MEEENNKNENGKKEFQEITYEETEVKIEEMNDQNEEKKNKNSNKIFLFEDRHLIKDFKKTEVIDWRNKEKV